MMFAAIWMTSKSERLYHEAFEALQDVLPEDCCPLHLMSDYEPALRNSLREVFPSATPSGCYFHLTQVRKKLLLL